jgi:RNA polymerase sigma-70 factor (ECF subfamily)
MSTITTSLLGRVQASLRDEAAWGRLMTLYGPLVYNRCRRGGVPPQDVGDVGQEVFLDVARQIADFRRDRPGDSFGGWLARITQRRVADYWRRRQRAPEGAAAGGSAARQRLAEVPEPSGRGVMPTPPSSAAIGPGEADDLRRRALRLIETRFEGRTWQACWRVVIDGRPIEVAAEELGLTPNAVRVAKSRVLSCLRDEFGSLLDGPFRSSFQA